MVYRTSPHMFSLVPMNGDVHEPIFSLMVSKMRQTTHSTTNHHIKFVLINPFPSVSFQASHKKYHDEVSSLFTHFGTARQYIYTNMTGTIIWPRMSSDASLDAVCEGQTNEKKDKRAF